MRTYLRDRTWLMALVLVIACTSYVTTQPTRHKAFLGWVYASEPLQATPVAGIPGVPSWAGPMWQPEESSGFPWVTVLVGLLALAVVIFVVRKFYRRNR